MKHSRKKGEGARLPEQDAIGSESDYPPGATEEAAPVEEAPFDAAATAQGSDGSGRTEASPQGDGGSAETGAGESAVDRDRYLRLAAEYDNYRKRSAKERQDAGARAQADLVRQLVDALDDVARFAHVDP